MRFLFVLLLFIAYGGYAQKSEGIVFEQSGMNEVLAKAAKENKIVFVDCYTEWCGPCQIMAKTVFTDKKVGKYFNQHFINMKMDMEKGEGPAIAKKYGVNAYPTFIFLNGKGELVHKFAGSKAADEFIKSAELAFSEQNIIKQSALFKEHMQDTAFVAAYMAKLYDENMTNELKVALTDYLGAISPNDYIRSYNWLMISKYEFDYSSPAVQYIIANYKDFVTLYGTDKVGYFLNEVYRRRIADQFGFNGKEFDQVEFDLFQMKLREIGLDFVPRRLATLYGFRAIHQKNYAELADIVDAMLRFELLDHDYFDKVMRMFSYINVALESKQPELCRKADEWACIMIKLFDSDFSTASMFWGNRVDLARLEGEARLDSIMKEKDAYFKQKYEAIPITKSLLEEEKTARSPEKYQQFVDELKRLKVEIR